MNAQESTEQSNVLQGEERRASRRNAAVAAPLLPDYSLIRRIGGGAYGDVWLARSTTGLLRAVKIVWRHTFEEERPFQREFEGIQRFERLSREHPSQLALFHVGRNEVAGYFYYVMELADTVVDAAPDKLSNEPARSDERSYAPRTLRADLSQGRLPATRVLEVGLALTEALIHLHENGLVHRDVKPSNVIFVNGRLKLADIGLVTDAGDTRSIVGTEGYLAPEGPGTPQADLFALGKVLYEASTGLDRHQFPRLPPDLRAWPDAALVFELNEIVLRACASASEDRYRSAQEIHTDLAALACGESVCRKRTLRRRFVLISRGFVLLSLLGAMVGGASHFLRNPGWWSRSPKLSSNDEATRLYKAGRLFYQKNTGDNLRQAIQLFEKALAEDPDFAPAHAAVASCHCWGLNDFEVDFTKARQHAQRALELDDKVAEAHKVMGWVKSKVDWDWPGSEQEFRRALELAPRDPTVHEWYGVFLGSMGRFDDSIRELKEAEILDEGLSLSVRMLLGGAYCCARKDELAIAQLQQVISFETNAPSAALVFLADLHELRGEFPEAIELRERWSRLAGKEDAATASRSAKELRAAFENGGRAGYWEKRLEWAKRDKGVYIIARVYAQIGDNDKAFEALQTELKSHSATLAANLMSDPALEGLRYDRRYAGLLRDMKLPDQGTGKAARDLAPGH